MDRPATDPDYFLAEIRRYFTESLRGGPADIGDDEPLLGDLLDSIGILTLANHLEEKYGIAIGAGEMDAANFGTLRSLAEFLTRKAADA